MSLDNKCRYTVSDIVKNAEFLKCIENQVNKTGTSQVGAISKAQKYSRNNYWKHLEKKLKKYFSKKVARCRKTQKEAI